MTRDDLIIDFKERVNSRYMVGKCPHGSNLLHQLNPTRRRSNHVHDALSIIVPEYETFVDSINALEIADSYPNVESATDILEKYLFLLRLPEANCFDSVADFLTSVVPEFYLRIFDRMIKALDIDLEASGQKEIPIEIAFDPNATNLLIPRFQRVDIAIIKRMSFVVGGHQLDEFCVPIYVAESKTYFDKNMISGVAYSSSSLKTTFPGCLCVSIGEWSDFDLEGQSFAATSIDEIYILRKQKRADYRRTRVLNPIASETMDMIFSQIWHLLTAFQQERPSLIQRMQTGQLIN